MNDDKILNKIFTITERMTVFDDVTDVLAHIVKTVTAMTSANAATIRVFDVPTGKLNTLGAYGLDEGASTQPSLPLGAGIAGTTVKEGKYIIIDNAHEDSLCAPCEIENINTHCTILCVPMTSKNSAIGCITIFRNVENKYTEHDVLLLKLFALEAVGAVEKARLLEELKRQASTDSLTGLLNKNSILDRLENEINRSRRYSFPLSVLFIDLDGFKEYNDTHGHLLGDKMLYDFGVLLIQQCRLPDIVGRFGGDEFVVIAPQTHEEGATVLGLRLCKAIATTDFFAHETTHITAKSSITCSIGISIMPDHGTNPQTLLNKADQALYISKRRGKNQVATWEE